MYEKIKVIADRYYEILELITVPDIIRDAPLLSQYLKEKDDIEDISNVYHKRENILKSLEEIKQIESDQFDEELVEKSVAEIPRLKTELVKLEEILNNWEKENA